MSHFNLAFLLAALHRKLSASTWMILSVGLGSTNHKLGKWINLGALWAASWSQWAAVVWQKLPSGGQCTAPNPTWSCSRLWEMKLSRLSKGPAIPPPQAGTNSCLFRAQCNFSFFIDARLPWEMLLAVLLLFISAKIAQGQAESSG